MTRLFSAGPLAAGLLFGLLAAPAQAQVVYASGGSPSYGGCASGGCGSGGCASCGTMTIGASCGCDKCPPPYKYYYEGPPELRFKKKCPRPICDPCELPHYGYYQTCWAPWPYPPDWTHCHTPPPGAVLPPPAVPPFTPKAPRYSPPATSTETDPGTKPSLPTPRKVVPERDSPPPRLDGGAPPPRLESSAPLPRLEINTARRREDSAPPRMETISSPSQEDNAPPPRQEPKTSIRVVE